MLLYTKYKPQLLSELEIEYEEIDNYLKLNKSFIITGNEYCGKSTIIKLYLDILNYDYLLIDDPYKTKDCIHDLIKY